MDANLYEPINVYKPVASNIDIVNGPFEFFALAGIRMPMPFVGRGHGQRDRLPGPRHHPRPPARY